MTEHKPGLAPRETFLEILKWMPIPTFDLILEYGDQGIILAKRTIVPYKDVWALPGLRKLKGESLDETIARIAQNELGLLIDPRNRHFVSQFIGFFEEENQREDVSTCYVIKVKDSQEVNKNPSHFSEVMILGINDPIPEPIGEMYKYFIEEYRRTK